MIKKILVISSLFTFILSPTTAQSPFSDVSTKHYAYKEINDIVSKGIMSGYKDNTFRPDKTITRGEMAVMLSRTIKYLEQTKEVNNNYTNINDNTVNVVANSMSKVVKVTTEKGVGTGFLISNNRVLTAQHVINGASKITVTLNNGTKFTPRIVKWDKNVDLALLQIESSTPLPYFEFENKTTLGESVLVIGSNLEQSNTVTRGIVSNLDRRGLIQTDAAVNEGSSGSPLINMQGKTIGVVVAKMDKVGIDNVTFAVNVKFIEDFINN